MIDPEIRDLMVSWPDNWQHRSPSGRSDVREVEWATARELAEQDVWRDRLKALKKLDLPTDAMTIMVDFNVEKLFAELKSVGAVYPPTWEDEKSWVERLGQEWHWELGSSFRRSRKIADSEMSSAIYWLLETRDQKERIKALVLFSSLLKVDPDADNTYRAFTFWKMISMYDDLKSAFGDK